MDALVLAMRRVLPARDLVRGTVFFLLQARTRQQQLPVPTRRRQQQRLRLRVHNGVRNVKICHQGVRNAKISII